MEKPLLMHPLVLLLSLCMLFWLGMPEAAFAQDACLYLTNNSGWNEGIKSVSQLIQAGNYTQARIEAKTLSQICDQSPVLHYMQGKIAQEMGEKSDALLHYQKASEYTYQFAVEPDMARKIWYARYENEHPERTAKSLEESARQNESKIYENTSELMSEFHKDIKARNYKMMWTGIGLGIGGLALLGTGVGLWASGYSYDMLDKDHHHAEKCPMGLNIK